MIFHSYISLPEGNSGHVVSYSAAPKLLGIYCEASHVDVSNV